MFTAWLVLGLSQRFLIRKLATSHGHELSLVAGHTGLVGASWVGIVGAW